MSNTTKPVLSVQPHDQVVLAVVECRDLEHNTTCQMQDELATALEAAPSMGLVLDLSRVEFVPSLAMGILVRVHKSLAQAGRRCVLVGVRPMVQEAMSVTGLTNFLVLRGTTEEALQFV
jgi:anti-anti-sigma factor